MNKNMSLSLQHFWVYLYWIGVNIVESLIYMYRCCSLFPNTYVSIYTELLWILWNYQRTSRWLSYFDKEESDSISLESATFLSVLGLGLKLMDADPFLVFLQQRNNTLKYCTYTTHKSTVHIPHTFCLCSPPVLNNQQYSTNKISKRIYVYCKSCVIQLCQH